MIAVLRIRRLLIALILAFVVLSGCAGPERPEEDASASLEHVHGLGVDPGDGVLYAGTHHGLFRVTDTAIEGPVADLEQDFMGFTVVGSAHFLASGHPGPGQSGPGALGLLESTDRGKTWKTRSLRGEADCHVLAHGNGTTYCMNSVTGELLASTDLESWDVRGTEPVFDIALSPNDPRKLIATTEQGVKSSSDSGRTLRPITGAPNLVFVEWLNDDSLIGVDPSGRVVRRGPGKRVFIESGRLNGQAEAFHATTAKTMFASIGGTIWTSVDGGRTFARLGRDSQ